MEAEYQVGHAEPPVVIVPVGKYEAKVSLPDISLEAYVPDQFSELAEEEAELPISKATADEDTKGEVKLRKAVLTIKNRDSVITKFVTMSRPCFFKNLLIKASESGFCAFSQGMKLVFENCDFEGKYGILMTDAELVVSNCKFSCECVVDSSSGSHRN
jgi:hypothetical protein